METLDRIYRGHVSDNDDPQQLGRVLVAVPKVVKGEQWAPVATLAAGPNRGTWFVPAVGDEVIVAFEAGDPRRPVVLGSLWSEAARPPETDPERAMIRTRALELLDDNGNGITLDPGGIRIRTSGALRVQTTLLDLSASSASFSTGIARFSGVVQTETLIATSVVASSYTPGAGNLW
jgi:phage baseplate assembly protein V